MFRQVGHNLGHQVVKSFLRKHNLDAWLSQWPCDRCRSLPSKSLGVGWCWMTINLVFRYSIVDHYQSWLGWSQFMLWVCRRIEDPGLIIIVAYDIIFDNFCDPYWNGHAAGISQFQTTETSKDLICRAHQVVEDFICFSMLYGNDQKCAA